MNKDGESTVSLDYYQEYVKENLPESWLRVAMNYNILEQLINAVTRYCFEYQLKDTELYYHLHENELICAASFDREPQGIDWWMNISSEASMLENHGCINTFADEKNNDSNSEKIQ